MSDIVTRFCDADLKFCATVRQFKESNKWMHKTVRIGGVVAKNWTPGYGTARDAIGTED